MKCKVCETNNDVLFTAKVLKKYDVKYYHCKSCGFLQTEEPYWLEEAYNESINISDTGIMNRNLFLSQSVTNIINVFFNKNDKFLDYAGGYGIFVRLMRDIGFDFYWNDKYSKNLVARKFEFNEKDSYSLLTSFESFEHFDKPILEIEDMLKISKSILFSTELCEDNPPKPDDWRYYGLNHGQHISFYSIKTLKYIAKKYNLNLYSYRSSLHLLTDKKINNYFFSLILKLNRLGLFYFLRKLNNSKTIKDWELLR
ncbi:MAG: class I SAM-dependent methyltransferase [Halarcobacter sp.]